MIRPKAAHQISHILTKLYQEIEYYSQKKRKKKRITQKAFLGQTYQRGQGKSKVNLPSLQSGDKRERW